jgi:3-hydroxyisobutyrate dehydrogenase
MKIAFLGMGLMGSRMSQRLLAAGFTVSVWNRTAQACEPLYLTGAQPLSSWADLTDHDVIGLCLSDDMAVQAVTDQITPFLRQGQMVVDFSSLSLSATQQLAAQVATQGAIWIDAPVSGGVMGAEQGSLVIFAGGDASAIAQLQPFFAPLCQRVTRMGDTGTGQVTKICNQLIVAASSHLIAEAVALARQAGVDASQLAPALAGGFADSKPFQILAPRMATGQFEPIQWKVKTLQKDLGNAISLATATGVQIPVATLAHQRLTTHATQGHAEHDLASLIRLIVS